MANLPDGSVEAVFEGDEELVDSMVRWCRQGPDGARVDELDALREEPDGERRLPASGTRGC